MRYFTKPPIGTPLNFAHRLNQGLVGYWPLGEGGGDKTQDISGKGNHGTLTNFVQRATSGWTGGKFGRAIMFDGLNGRVDLGLPLKLFTQFTVCAWVKDDSIGATEFIVSQRGAGAPGWWELIGRSANAGYRFEFANSVGGGVLFKVQCMLYRIMSGISYAEHLILILV